MFRNWACRGFLPLLSLLLAMNYVGIHGQDVCQDGTGPNGNGTLCDCQLISGTVLNVNCSSRVLDEIPVIPANTGVLDLTDNNIVVIRVQDFNRLDTLQKLVLTGNPLECNCDLIDFKSWVINMQSVSATAQLIEGAICGDSTFSGLNVIDALFCFQSLLCHVCHNVIEGSECSSGSCPLDSNTCKNDLNYRPDGSVWITKSCVSMADCRQAALTVNEAECRQADGATSRCVYCCQGDDCNDELNTINDTYVFPFRRSLSVTTPMPITTDNGWQSTDYSSTSKTQRMESTQSSPTPYQQTSETLRETTATTAPSMSTAPPTTSQTRPTESTQSSPAPYLQTSESPREPTATAAPSMSTARPTTGQTRRTESTQSSPAPYLQTSESPRETTATTAPSMSTARLTTDRKVTSPCSQVPPNRWCLSETTEGEWGSITWPSVVADQTTIMPCPYKNLADPEGSKYAQRSCLWDATSNQASWEQPDVGECPTASGVLDELAKTEITESNALDVSAQLTIVTSHAVTLIANEVTSAVDALKRLLDALLRYPEKGQDIFMDAMTTVEQMTSVKVEELIESQKINRTTSRLLQLIDKFAFHVPFLNVSKLTAESRAIDTILLNTADQPTDDLLFGGSLRGDDVKPFLVLNGSSPENMTDIVASVKLPSSLLHNLAGQVNRTQFLMYQGTTYFNVITSSVVKPYGDLTTPIEGASTVLSSVVISASLGDLSIADLQEPVLIRLKKSQIENATNPQCAFWDTQANDKQGGWSAKGCAVNFDLSDSTTIVCECNHLTNFAMLMDVYGMGELDPVHSKILAIISYIGCSLSILALTLAVVTLGCCKEDPRYRVTASGSLNAGASGKDRADRHTNILLHLSVGLILADASFLLNTVTVELEFGHDTCLGIAVATHYSLLVAMAWMALEAFNMYLALVLVFDKYYSRFMLKMCLFGWVAPLIVVAVTLSINFPNNYGLVNGICWLSRVPFLASFLAPVCAVLLFNLVVFVAVTWQLCKMRRRNISQSRRSFDLAAQFKASASITFLFGLTWAFALFGIGDARLAFSYLFAIFNSAQGFNIFVFQCLLKPSIRKRWLKWLRKEQEDMQGSSKSSGSKDSKNVEMFKVTGSVQNNSQPKNRL